MTVWIAVLGAGLASYLLRFLPVVLLAGEHRPAWLDRAAVLVAPVAFAAMAATSVAGGAAGGAAHVAPRVAALVVAGAVAHRTRSTGWAVVAGMATLWLGAALAAAT